MLNSSTWILRINPQGFAQTFWEILHFKVWKVRKHEKLASFPYRGMKTLRDLFLILPGEPQMSRERFYLYSFIKRSENEASRPF